MTTRVETRLTVHIHPNASRNKLVNFKDGILRVNIIAPPVDGKANRELVGFLSECLGIRKSDISIKRGFTGRTKVVTFYGTEHAQLARMISDTLTK